MLHEYLLFRDCLENGSGLVIELETFNQSKLLFSVGIHSCNNTLLVLFHLSIVMFNQG